MAAAEEPGVLRVLAETPSGDQEVLVASIRTEPLSTTTIAQRARLDVQESVTAQRKAPTPTNGRPIVDVHRHIVPEDGFVIVQHKSDAADTHDPDDALAKCNLSVLQRDLTKRGTPLEYRMRTLTVADRDTTRIADDQVLSTTSFVGIYAFKVPTGMQWMLHGEQEIFVADDTA